jgi:hypothetical protein
MIEIERRAREEAGFTGHALRQMIHRIGGYRTAKRLLCPDPHGVIHDGLVDLFARGRVDLSVEALVVRPEWAELFKAEQKEAHRRLAMCDYTARRIA